MSVRPFLVSRCPLNRSSRRSAYSNNLTQPFHVPIRGHLGFIIRSTRTASQTIRTKSHHVLEGIFAAPFWSLEGVSPKPMPFCTPTSGFLILTASSNSLYPARLIKGAEFSGNVSRALNSFDW